MIQSRIFVMGCMGYQNFLESVITAVVLIFSVSACFFSIRALTQKRYGFGGWLNNHKYIFLIAAVFCACYSLNLYSENLALYHEYVVNGEHTEGCVYHVTKRERRGLRTARSNYYHTIRYIDNYNQEQKTVYRSNGSMDIGDIVEVYYKRNNPSDAYVVTYQESLCNTVCGIIFGICCVLLSIVSLVVIWLNRKSVLHPHS